MPPENQAKLKKLQNFADHEMLAIFNELGDLNENIAKVIKAVESSKQTDITINNPEDISLDLTPLEASFDTLKGTSQGIITAIKDIKGVDMSGVEKLLQKIADKEDKDIDVTELSNISEILGNVLLAVQTTASATDLKPTEREKTIPELKEIQRILNTLNNNLVEFDVPDFDYKRLEDILKRNLNISVSGGGGINKHILNKAGTTINPATEDTLSKLVGLAITQYDYVSQTQNSTQDIWTFKNGGSGGTTVATITITYTDSTKVTISTVAKT